MLQQPKESVKPPPGRKILMIAVSQVPLAHNMCGVSSCMQVLRQQLVLSGQPSWLKPLNSSPLPPHGPGIPPSQEGGTGGGALGVHIVTLKDDAFSE